VRIWDTGERWGQRIIWTDGQRRHLAATPISGTVEYWSWIEGPDGEELDGEWLDAPPLGWAQRGARL
jgi:hypothetical protein